MHLPFEIIESKMTYRKQFEMVEGYQPSHALFYLKKGSFFVEIDGQKEEVYPGECVILPDYVHFSRSVLYPIEFVYVKFTYQQSCPYSLPMPYGKVIYRDKERFQYNITMLERLLTNDDALSVGYREHLLNDILFQIFFEQNPLQEPSGRQPVHDRLVASAASYIQDNLDKKILIEEVCRVVGTNASTLNFKFRREFDQSVGQYITSERMKKARHLLMSTTYSLAEIAVRCGFENGYYFSNAFKKWNGVSPSAYRR